MLFVELAKDLALLLDRNIWFFLFGRLRRALERLLDVFVADRPKSYRAAEQARQLIARFLGAFLRCGLEHDAFFFENHRADTALETAGRLEPDIAVVALIDDIVTVRQGPDRRAAVQQIEYDFGEYKRLSVTGNKLRAGLQRDPFQPQLMKDRRHLFEEVGKTFNGKFMRENLVRLPEAL